jgi:hypothetical protein
VGSGLVPAQSYPTHSRNVCRAVFNGFSCIHRKIYFKKYIVADAKSFCLPHFWKTAARSLSYDLCIYNNNTDAVVSYIVSPKRKI